MSRTDTPALPVPPSRRTTRERAPAGSPGDALMAAQAETRRGLRAGPSALVHAKSAYGEAQWSGEADRRPEPGLLVRATL